MPPLREIQTLFAEMAFSGREPATIAPHLRDDGPIPAAQRLEIYRNNSWAGLSGPLAETFPVVARLVGEDFFARMIHDFICAHPPRRPELLSYGMELPGFIALYRAAAGVPYLADMARLELALNFAYHAADRAPMPASALTAFSPEQLEGLCLLTHPSLRFVASPWPLRKIWQAHQSEEVGAVELVRGEDLLLVYRPCEETLIRKVGRGAFDLVMALAAGQPLAAACATARAADPAIDLTGELANLLAADIFVEPIPS